MMPRAIDFSDLEIHNDLMSEAEALAEARDVTLVEALRDLRGTPGAPELFGIAGEVLEAWCDWAIGEVL